ncbi:hypothetical protein GUJ93_ZPchr0005g15111 [Zizania palustris]|uniref:Uncharacterized protein n=1 Tax=Zizania palustris TaxID=103762 RepID=A0A8J5SMF1_ZIZPA|nr:hypothetical protein GUJ93_ZPchr0005g15111 [Zizania palustris]
MAEVQEQEWEGAVEARLPSTPAAAAWPHIASFCALHRYLPSIDVCERVAGEDGLPGCVRYVASHLPPPPPAATQEEQGDQNGQGEGAAAAAAADVVELWAREELLEMDDARRRLVYAIVGSNMGFGRYVSTMRVVAEDDLDDKEEHTTSPTAPAAAAGCRLVWAFECEPVHGWSRDGLVAYLDASVKGIAERIESAATTALDEDDGATACS